MCDNHFKANKITLSKVNNCCRIEVAAKPIKDEYLSQKANLNEVKISDIINFIFPNNYNFFNYTGLNLEFKENSPPGNFNTPDYISNLQLLI